MSGDEISEDLIKIKTFREYLDHIVNQIESEKYEVDRVKKLSELITDVFNEVNDDISDDSDLEVISTAAISDSESASSENTIDNNLLFVTFLCFFQHNSLFKKGGKSTFHVPSHHTNFPLFFLPKVQISH